MPHYCQAKGCHTPIPSQMLMCYKHWRMVNRKLQNRVCENYRPEEDKQSSAYSDARAEAIAEVEQKEAG